MNVLVTGGAGFIGSNIVRKLLENGDTVRVIDNFSGGKKENLEEVKDHVEVIEADIRDPEKCRLACQGMDGVLHEAALGSVPRSIDDPMTSHDVNVNGTLNMLVAARDCGVRRFVFASSSSVYGNAPERVKVESLPVRPLSPYAVSKVAAEYYVRTFHSVYGLETIALRYFNVFGPRQDPESMYAAVFPRFATALLSGRAPTIYGDGEQSRDFTYVENVVDANLLALECGSEAFGKGINVACGGSVSVLELFRLIREAAGQVAAQVDPSFDPPRVGDVRDSLASIDEAKSSLGFAPKTGVKEGVERTVRWYRSNLELV